MKATIEVKDRKEADAIRIGLDDPTIRAFVVMMGVLKELPSDRARKRVLQYIADYFEENPTSRKEQDA
ncbi:MAG TPA: hypothetical protein VKE42_02400 [Candidatus Cybelea sp.]|nr:hypothetical protein [Candidatus Cybelea sp.]